MISVKALSQTKKKWKLRSQVFLTLLKLLKKRKIWRAQGLSPRINLIALKSWKKVKSSPETSVELIL